MALYERIEGMTLASVLANRATADPERPFLRTSSEVLSVGRVESRAEALAAALHGLGIEAGDRIALVLPPSSEFVLSLLAAAKLGAVAVPLDPRLTQAELQYMLRHSRAVCAVAVEELEETDYLQVFEEILVQLPELHYLVTVGEEDLWYDDRIFQFEDLLSVGGGRNYGAPEVTPEKDAAALVYTSGTTGKPKGVELTHRNLLYAAAGTAEAVGLTEDDRIGGVSSLFHVFGIGPGILGALLSGASFLVEGAGETKESLDRIEEHRLTVQYGVPTLFVTQLHALEEGRWDLSSLRLGVLAGAPVAEELVRRIEAELCPVALVAYSLTETASTAAITRSIDPAEKRRFTVGRPLPGTRIRVVDPEDRTELPTESVGEISVRGPGVLRGYYRQPRETAERFDEAGFFLTGDLGMLDEEGYLHLVGRRKEVIIKGGSNVYPREVEDRLHSHPAVREAVVVGVPDDVLGEAICACIVPVEGAIVTEDEVQDWCAVTLADYKVPDQVRFLDTFPLTGTGKIRRIELARRMSRERIGRNA